MTLRIRWNYPALATLYNLSLHDAMVLDRAVIRFAETGQGILEWDPPYHRLRTGAHDAMLSIDTAAREMCVIRVYRAR